MKTQSQPNPIPIEEEEENEDWDVGLIPLPPPLTQPVVPQTPPAPVLVRPNLGPVDQLAYDLFRHTRSRGPVAQALPPPDRPLEYSQRKPRR